MRLHSSSSSPNGRRTEAVVRHLGLAIEIVQVDLKAGAQRTPQHLALNPNGRIPVLEDDGLRLWESNAIIQYLADKAGDAVLFPRDPVRRADVVRWQFWASEHFNRALTTLAWELRGKPALGLGEPDCHLVAIAQGDFAAYAPVLEAHLAGRRYLLGDDMTLADYVVGTYEPYRQALPVDWAAHPNLSAYFDRLAASPHWLPKASSQASALETA